MNFFVNDAEGEVVNSKEFSSSPQPGAAGLRISAMTWEAYCREEARECAKLARVTQGEARKDWADAARQWRMQLERLARPDTRAPQRRRG